jgi:hypothetical protein
MRVPAATSAAAQAIAIANHQQATPMAVQFVVASRTGITHRFL